MSVVPVAAVAITDEVAILLAVCMCLDMLWLILDSCLVDNSWVDLSVSKISFRNPVCCIVSLAAKSPIGLYICDLPDPNASSSCFILLPDLYFALSIGKTASVPCSIARKPESGPANTPPSAA